jgi:restriction endonuclease S subunit
MIEEGVTILKYEQLDKIAQIYNGLRITRYADKDNSNMKEVLKKINNKENLLETEQLSLTDSIDEKYYSKENDIIIQTTSQINTINIIKKENIIIPANYIIIRTNKEHNPYYILYLLESNQFKKVERKLSGGSNLHFLKIPDLRKMNVKIPSKEKQDRIVNILKLIDEKNKLEEKKIKLNKQITEAIFIKQLGEEYVQ